jgi:hypothetical protein
MKLTNMLPHEEGAGTAAGCLTASNESNKYQVVTLPLQQRYWRLIARAKQRWSASVLGFGSVHHVTLSSLL